jgi:STE24 endopeptidase
MTFEGAADTAQSPLALPTPQQIGSSHDPQQAKRYTRTKLLTAVASSLLSFAFLFLLVALGVTVRLENWARSLATNDYAALLLFAGAIGLLQGALTTPIGYYSSYYLEHKYKLSNQSLGRWAWERLKGILVSLPIALPVLLFVYFCILRYQQWWWLPVSGAIILLSVVLARVAPVLIFPLFYKFTPLESESLGRRIEDLCADAGVSVRGIFSFNLSKNTKKANAAFTGLGKAKRIILGDTLLSGFSEEEIEAVFAHELGHYKHKHLLIGILVSIVSTVFGLFFAAFLYGRSLGVFGFGSISQLAALPLLALWLSLFGLITTPLGNMLSRYFERVADRYAVRTMGTSIPFVSALRKLSITNLAHPDPHPLVEFFFYSHPSITKRIRFVEGLFRQ